MLWKNLISGPAAKWPFVATNRIKTHHLKHKTKLQPKTLDFEGFLLFLPYPYLSADNSSTLTEKERCCKREKEAREREREV